jgi:hypothetical protein
LQGGSVQCVGISVVKNESDIIEVFIRHNLKHLNKLYLVEHNSQDNTPEIISKLKSEGYNLEIYTNSSSRHIQAEEFNRLIREIDSEFIIFLDADEFIISNDFTASLDKLPTDKNSLVVWHNYLPQSGDDKSEINVLKRIQHRLSPVDINQHKSLIPRPVYSKPNSFVLLGGHEIYYKNEEEITVAPCQVTASVHLAHFPMRSLDQIKVKVFSNWLSKLADPLHISGRLQEGKIPTWHHWKTLFDLFKNNPAITEDEAILAVVEVYMRCSKIKKDLKVIYDPVINDDKIIYDIKSLSPLFALADASERQVVMLQKANAFILNIINGIKNLDAI